MLGEEICVRDQRSQRQNPLLPPPTALTKTVGDVWGGDFFRAKQSMKKNFTGFKACVVCLIRPLSELDLIYFAYFF